MHICMLSGKLRIMDYKNVNISITEVIRSWEDQEFPFCWELGRTKEGCLIKCHLNNDMLGKENLLKIILTTSREIHQERRCDNDGIWEHEKGIKNNDGSYIRHLTRHTVF